MRALAIVVASMTLSCSGLAMSALGAGAGAGRAGGGDGDLAGRCKQGFDMFEQSLCGPGHDERPELLRFKLDEFKRQCKDADSVARIASIERTCIPQHFDAQTKREDDRRKIRAQYVAQVSDLLLDPEYAPAADAYKDIEERAFHDPDDATLKTALSAARAKLASIARRHGVDPAYAKELQLW